jgi:NAD(P)-dependent dehydrogenase (short-subunit alcohol dehydrogenase family)
MELHLGNRHVLVTGGSKGIGLACARLFLAEGARVSLVSRGTENLAQARSVLLASQPDAASRLCLFAADLKQPAEALAALDSAEQALGAVDILVNSAGAARRTPADDLTPQAWRDAMDAKFFTYLHMIDPVIKRMGQRGRGGLWRARRAGGRRQPGPDTDRPPAGGPADRGPARGHQHGRSPAAGHAPDSAGPPCQTRGDCRRRGLAGLGPGQLCHRRAADHGRGDDAAGGLTGLAFNVAQCAASMKAVTRSS